MNFDWTIKFGDILTSITVLVSACALLVSWSKDQTTRQAQQADRVRQSVADALTQLDRWQLLVVSLYDELQPVFIDTSEGLEKDFQIVRSRDYLWKTINERRGAIAAKILEEKILTSYVGLLAYLPPQARLYEQTFEKLRILEDDVTASLIEETQRDVMSMESRREGFTSAILGNALRGTAGAHRKKLVTESTAVIRPVRDELLRVISLPDVGITTASARVP